MSALCTIAVIGQESVNQNDKLKDDEVLACPSCHKQAPLCLCADVRPVKTPVHVLILQHPQEPDKLLGSARLAHSILENSTLKVGLSWPNLAKALGRAADPARWGVLYLGPKTDSKAKGLRIKPKTAKDFKPYSANPVELDGLIILDGTWSQAKTMWWRNAWLLKLNRLALDPARGSLYGQLRREPRRDALSTIETIAETFDALAPECHESERPDLKAASEALRASFAELLRRYRETPSCAERAEKSGSRRAR